MANKIYQHDSSVEFIINIGCSTDGASDTHFEITKPSGATVTWLASVKDSTSLNYYTTDQDLDEAGTYVLQAVVAWGDTSVHRGESVKFKVYENFK